MDSTQDPGICSDAGQIRWRQCFRRHAKTVGKTRRMPLALFQPVKNGTNTAGGQRNARIRRAIIQVEGVAIGSQGVAHTGASARHRPVRAADRVAPGAGPGRSPGGELALAFQERHQLPEGGAKAQAQPLVFGHDPVVVATGQEIPSITGHRLRWAWASAARPRLVRPGPARLRSGPRRRRRGHPGASGWSGHPLR